MQTAGGKKSPAALAVGAACYEAARQDVSAGIIVAWPLQRQPAAFPLDLRHACSTEGNPFYYKPGQKPGLRRSQDLLWELLLLFW